MILTSFSEFKFYQSFRIPVQATDELRFLVEIVDENGKRSYLNDAKLLDISITGLGFSTNERVCIGSELYISLHFKKTQLDLNGTVVRAFTNPQVKDGMVYGVEVDKDTRLISMLEKYVQNFHGDRARECLTEAALRERYTKPTDGFEMFSLLLSLFQDITNIGDKEGFIENMLEEVARVLNAQRASVFLINPETNELEAVAALGVDKTLLKFDYRQGIAGSVFTSGVALNIDTINDKTRFNDAFDKKLGFETKSIICYPISNREDKIIGVIEVLNKRNQDRFTIEDEKTMKVLSLVFSSVFHTYQPISEHSAIRRFSTAFDRKYVFIGKTMHINELRKSIIKLKDIDCPVLVTGESGVGKTLYAQILHNEGTRGLQKHEIIDCKMNDKKLLFTKLFDSSSTEYVFTINHKGTIILKHVDALSLDMQKHLWQLLNPTGDTVSELNVRIIATSSCDLEQLVQDGSFDQEFYRYLSKSLVNIMPLRKRVDDIIELANYYLKQECKKQGLLVKTLLPEAIEFLKSYEWIGNAEELKMCIDRVVLYNPSIHTLDVEHFKSNLTVMPLVDVNATKRMFGDIPFVDDHELPLKDRMLLIEREVILAEIKRNNDNKSLAAKKMGISREALRKKLLQSESTLIQTKNSKEQKEAA